MQIEKALKHCAEKKITIGKAAALTGLMLREALALASAKGIPFQYTVRELQEDFKEALKIKKAKKTNPLKTFFLLK